jgi:hypothetical protein
MTNPNPDGSPRLRLFNENVQYAKDLIAGGVALQCLRDFPAANYGDLSKAHPEDLYRAAWNQAVAAMDHWFHDEVIERAVKLTNDIGNRRPASLANLKMPFKMVERMRNEAPHVVFRAFLEDEYRRRSFHSTDDITVGIKLITYLTSNEIWDTVGRAFNMTRDQVRQHHDGEIIKRRNDISHRADRDANGQRQPMSEAEACSAVDWIDKLVHELFTFLE